METWIIKAIKKKKKYLTIQQSSGFETLLIAFAIFSSLKIMAVMLQKMLIK